MIGDRLPALTLWPEWAFAIAHLGKRVENRVWEPPRWLVGKWLAIHAGAHIGGRPGRVAVLEGLEAVRDEAARAGVNVRPPLVPAAGEQLDLVVERPSGDVTLTVATRAIVCLARLSHVERVNVGPLSRPPWVVGPVCWRFDQVIPIEPVAIGGRQGVWDVPRPQLARVRAQIQEAR